MKKSINLVAFITAFSLHLIIGGILLMNMEFSLPKEKPKQAVSVIDAQLVSQQLFDDLADKKAREKAAKERAKREKAAKEKAKREKAKREKLAREKAAKEKAAREKAAKEKAAREKATKEKAAREKAAKEKAAREKAAKEKAAREKAAKEKAAREKAAKEKAAREKAAKEKAAREKAAKEKAAREKAAKEKAAREKAAKEKAAREKAAKEKAAAEAAERERLRQEELDRLMEAEFAEEFSNARSAKQLSEIAKYQALISAKIQRYWKVDPSMQGKECKVAIVLAADGYLISAKKVSGDKKVCDSAIRATKQAKTLPIPKDPEIASQFRDFDIILEPDL